MLILAYNLIKINFLDYLPFLYIRTICICIYCKYYCLMGRLVFQLIHNDQNYANLFYKKAFLLFSYFIFFPFIILYKYHIISFIKNQAAGGTSIKTYQPRRRNYEKHLSNISFFGVCSSLTNSLHSKLNSKNSGRK